MQVITIETGRHRKSEESKTLQKKRKTNITAPFWPESPVYKVKRGNKISYPSFTSTYKESVHFTPSFFLNSSKSVSKL